MSPKIEIGLFQYIVWENLISIQWVKQGLDQPIHPPCKARVLVYPSFKDSLEAVEGKCDSRDSDQTEPLCRLI